ncbi:unnamed protein product [Prorocentrum cordatum]|uniref:Glycosyltransferase 2-like domain-containing protein n=1 Tax=Prorocentrum cordatum TaxID=2364126 RepID=A0ABN9VBW5_9DINO|nr:unnamed protein product [Polarella glacialis]
MWPLVQVLALAGAATLGFVFLRQGSLRGIASADVREWYANDTDGSESDLGTVSPHLGPREFPVPPQVLHSRCLSAKFNTTRFPNVSIIIPYLNESWSQMRATVGSILSYSPMDLVDNILFIDDGNSAEWQFHDQLRALHTKVTVHRNDRREGLIRSRVIGARRTTSEVLVFMEPHCVVQPRWIEPLLERMAGSEDHATVVAPVIDVIPEADFSKYRASHSQVGGFDWTLTFRWAAFPEYRNASYRYPEPFASPAISGGIFGIWRDFWERLGEYDMGMSAWGGETSSCRCGPGAAAGASSSFPAPAWGTCSGPRIPTRSAARRCSGTTRGSPRSGSTSTPQLPRRRPVGGGAGPRRRLRAPAAAQGAGLPVHGVVRRARVPRVAALGCALGLLGVRPLQDGSR